MPANRYAHIASRIRDRIGDGTLATGARLPAETDLMAEFAGLRPIARYGGWTREPFKADSAINVTVYSGRS